MTTTTDKLPIGNYMGFMLLAKIESELTKELQRGEELLEQYKDNPQDCPNAYSEVEEMVLTFREALDKLRKGEIE